MQAPLNRIKHGGKFSDYYEVLQGVAQGCPLSPILFIIFMNDLQETLHTVCANHGVTIKFDEHSRPYVSQAFADDTSGVSPSSTTDNMQAVVNVMYAPQLRVALGRQRSQEQHVANCKR